MSLREYLAGELIDIIEWNDDSTDTMSYRFSRPNNEIKNGAQLIVRPAQMAILVNQGQIADVFQPGRHDLSTENIPILSRLQGWKYGFNSPFKADVVFLSTRQFVGRKWGTSNPVILRDPELGPVRLRAFGTYAVRIVDALKFIQELAGTNAVFSVDQINDQLRDMVVATVSGVLADCGISVYVLSSKYADLAARIQQQATARFQQYGLTVEQVVVENISLPPEVEATLDQKTRMSMLGDLGTYTQLASADAIRDAARNPGGGAAAGVGIGMGAALGQRAASVAGGAAAASQAPPPLATTMWYYAIGSERKGPMDEAALKALTTLTPETLVWHQGMATWAAAGTMAELSSLFPPPPPPLPQS